MTNRTIPAPSDNDMDAARLAMRMMASRSGLDVRDSGVVTMVNLGAEVVAQQLAEIRWLRNIVHAREYSNE